MSPTTSCGLRRMARVAFLTTAWPRSIRGRRGRKFAPVYLSRAEGDPLVLWGASAGAGLSNLLTRQRVYGWYLPYPPADGIAIAPVEDPPNQIPYLRGLPEPLLHLRP